MSDALEARIDRLYELLPAVYRIQDTERGFPLRDLLRAIAEQVNVLEDDIAQMYDDWFIETCSDWVVPYLGDLVGYPDAAAVIPGDPSGPEARRLGRVLAPRRDVADYLRNLRRRGTAALLEQLAHDSAGFSARVVELFTLLGWTQNLNHRNAGRGQFVQLRDVEALELIDSPFDRAAHTIDTRNATAARNYGLHNIPNAAAYLWRLRVFPVTNAAAYLPQRTATNFYAFSQLGNDAPLFTSARYEPDPTAIAGELNVPAPIRRRALELRPREYYPESFSIRLNGSETPVPVEDLVVADLSNWTYVPKEGKVAIDPELGRLAFAEEPEAVRVSYHYGFSGDVGAHESPRVLAQPRDAVLYRVGAGEKHPSITAALEAWAKEKPEHAVIEIADSDTYTENVPIIDLAARQSLQLRGAQRTRPVLRILDYGPSRSESLRVRMNHGSRFTLDGIVLSGRPLRIGGKDKDDTPLVRVTVRRATLVPGWDIDEKRCPMQPEESSVIVENVRGTIAVDRSIVGTITVRNAVAEADPVRIDLRDSIVDATSDTRDAIHGYGGYAWANLRIARCTVIGEVLAHAMELAENSIFTGLVTIVRRQTGCVRFCHLPPGSRTPRRYHCQPVHEASEEEVRRVKPRFTNEVFGSPGYCQLAFDCADEIARGAEDEGEMGAFHDLFLPQRVAALRARLDHSTPAGLETGIIFAD
jgi:hypothetical protein